MNKEEAKDELIKVLYSQVTDLSMMSKIELGDDVILYRVHYLRR